MLNYLTNFPSNLLMRSLSLSVSWMTKQKKCIKDSTIAVSLSHCVFHKSSIILLFLGFHKQEVSIYSDNPLCSPSYNSIILRVNNCSNTSKLSYFNATIFNATILSSMDNKEKYDTSICMKKWRAREMT